VGRRKIFAGVTGVAVVLGGAVALGPASASAASSGAAATTSATVPTPPPITWSACTDIAATAQCGFLTVPLDYNHPAGAKIQLAVSRIPHTVAANKYQGVMLVNPGGPGGSGLGLSILGQFVPNHAGDAYDWIGFDPRGVGSSVPSLSCKPNYFHNDRPNYIPTSQSLVNTWLTMTKNYAIACGNAQPALLQHMKTTDSAKDMESIRLALGVQKINYYGFSYGTYLGQVYSTLYPTRVRRMVLDSNVDPRRVWYGANLDQDTAFDRNINIWFGWLAKYNNVYHLGATQKAVHDLWYAQLAALTKNPAGGKLGPDEWTDAFLFAGYYQSTWTDLGSTFAAWVHQHDLNAVLAAFKDADGPGDDNGYAVYDAVQCTDVQWPQSWAKWQKDNSAIYQQAPFETWSNAWYNAPCLNWPAKPGTPVKIDGSKVSSALLVDETLDAATPYTGSLEVRRLYPHSALLALPGGTSHANSLFGDACEDNTIARYLADGTLPPRRAGNNTADAFCAPLPQPVPTSASTVQAPFQQATGAATPQRPPMLFAHP
jgi:pimeloyl-ACP methyl ester carboxylesterase